MSQNIHNEGRYDSNSKSKIDWFLIPITEVKRRVGDSSQCSFLFTRANTRLSRVTRNKKKQKNTKVDTACSPLACSCSDTVCTRTISWLVTVRQRLRWFIDLFGRRIYLRHIWQNQTRWLKFHLLLFSVESPMFFFVLFFFPASFQSPETLSLLKYYSNLSNPDLQKATSVNSSCFLEAF